MNNFKNLETTKLGELAEKYLLAEFITSKGYLPMTNCLDGPHAVDGFAISKDANKRPFLLEIKAKSRLKYYEGTGIDMNDYQYYLEYSKKQIPVYLLIADMLTGTAYGQWIERLTPFEINGARADLAYLPLSAMTHYRDLTDVEIATLKSHENSNYN